MCNADCSIPHKAAGQFIHSRGHWPDLNTCQLRLAVVGLFDKLLPMDATAAEGAASMLRVLLPCQRSWLVCRYAYVAALLCSQRVWA